MFGRPIKQTSVCYWGARAIYEGRAGKYFVDILYDRQSREDSVEAYRMHRHQCGKRCCSGLLLMFFS